MFGGVALVAHLGLDVVFSGGLGQGSGFVDRVGEGFFAVDVFASFYCCHCYDGVGVVGGCDYDGVEVFFFVEHDAEVLVFVCLGEIVEGFGGSFAVVDIAKGDDVFVYDGPASTVGPAAACYADDGDV